VNLTPILEGADPTCHPAGCSAVEIQQRMGVVSNVMSASGSGCVKTLLRITWISFAAQDAYIAISGDQCGHRDVCHRICNSIRRWRKGLAVLAGSEARSHSRGDRLHQWCDPHDSYHPLQVVREHVQAHLGTDVLKRACQEVRITHP
jgi:hypothetical protein